MEKKLPARLDTAEFASMMQLVTGRAKELIAIVPGDKDAPVEAKAAALVLSSLMGLGPKGYQVYKVKNRYVVEPTYQSLTTIAKRHSDFRVEYEPVDPKDYISADQLKDNPNVMAVRCTVWRDDDLRRQLQLRREAMDAGIKADELEDYGLGIRPTATAVGIYYGAKMEYNEYKKEWRKDRLPTTWTPEDVAKKRALKKALRIAYGDLSMPPDAIVDVKAEGAPDIVVEGPPMLTTTYAHQTFTRALDTWGDNIGVMSPEEMNRALEYEEEVQEMLASEPDEESVEMGKAMLGGGRKKRLGDDPPPEAAPPPPDFVAWFREFEENPDEMTKGKKGAIRGHLAEFGDRDDILDFLTAITGRKIESSNDLTDVEWNALYVWLSPRKDEETKKWYINDKAKSTFAQVLSWHRNTGRLI